ncbi:MAG: porin [Paraprevotella sp.]|nr:porin [Paraprevotella sp.]
MRFKKSMLLMLCGAMPSLAFPKIFGGQYTTEWQWNMNNKTNWVNQLRLGMNYSPWKNGLFQVATIHTAKTNETIIDDWQTFSNIEDENNFAAIAVLGYMQTWEHAHLFVGVRNVNEDFFTSDGTSLFTSSSPGIFPTISASYPIANYPLNGLTVHFDVEWKNWTFMNSLYNGKGYNGWNRHDNPFRVKPNQDGVFDMMQLTYTYDHGFYSAGAAIHSRLYPTDEEGEMAEEPIKKTSCAWWVYGEQSLWESGENKVSLMAQYSENTNKQNGCRRYGKV